MLRSVVRVGIRARLVYRASQTTGVYVRASSAVFTPFRTYASSPSDLDQTLSNIAEAMESSPKLKQCAKNLKEVFEAKGVKPGVEPNMFQLAKLLMDKKVSDALKDFYVELRKNNISCTPEDLKALLSIYSKQK
ncbi:hypothetical protein PSN45_001327 [Yamadazyma tenuis]|uniref:uncharacterized protein n=1 Tax=Candida tenuis TaxID=2315449 RepID=UPI0027A2EC2E|nr:hypothetical protein PSN45_001327 [Yamadazyma tenuis]